MKHKSISEFASALGVSHTAIAKAINTGRIPAEFVSTKKTPSGRQRRVITNPAAARSAYLRQADEASTSNDVDTPVGDDDAKRSSAPQGTNDAGVPSIEKSLRVKEMYRANLARLDFEERAGKLVNAHEFRAKYSTMIVAARTRLLAVPSQAKGRIPHLTIDEVEILTELIREALESVADGADKRLMAFMESIKQQWSPLFAEPTLMHEEHKS